MYNNMYQRKEVFFDVSGYRKIDTRDEVAKGTHSEAQRGLRDR
jgi:hypothetical protein